MSVSQESIYILDKEYLVACTPKERDALRESGRIVDEKMREIRQNGKVIGTERIAVMAALNIAHDLLLEKHGDETRDETMRNRLRLMQQKIEALLVGEERQLKL